MRVLPLTLGYFTVVDDSDYLYASAYKWTAQETRWPDGTIKAIYAYRRTKQSEGLPRRKVYLHRVLCGITDTSIQVDHRDSDGRNNQRYNLRVCSNTQNSRHQRMKSSNTSGRKGVCWNKNEQKWQSNITIAGKLILLGLFDSLDAAAVAYDRAASEYFGDFALTNQSGAA